MEPGFDEVIGGVIIGVDEVLVYVEQCSEHGVPAGVREGRRSRLEYSTSEVEFDSVFLKPHDYWVWSKRR